MVTLERTMFLKKWGSVTTHMFFTTNFQKSEIETIKVCISIFFICFFVWALSPAGGKRFTNTRLCPPGDRNRGCWVFGVHRSPGKSGGLGSVFFFVGSKASKLMIYLLVPCWCVMVEFHCFSAAKAFLRLGRNMVSPMCSIRGTIYISGWLPSSGCNNFRGILELFASD